MFASAAEEMELSGKLLTFLWRARVMADEHGFPRELTALERELLLWVLPEDRPGYNECRRLVQSWKVAGQGRRGEGNYILARAGEQIDTESPLPQLLAYGVLRTSTGDISVAVRERLDDQLEFEVVNLRAEGLPAEFEERSRWTFSTWLPGLPCPICAAPLREVSMKTEGGRLLVLAVCARDRRIWVHNGATGINHPIPVTNMYNELMLHKHIRDPKIALSFDHFFTDLPKFTDDDLTSAFASYNNVRTKVPLAGRIAVENPSRSSLLKRLLARIKS